MSKTNCWPVGSSLWGPQLTWLRQVTVRPPLLRRQPPVLKSTIVSQWGRVHCIYKVHVCTKSQRPALVAAAPLPSPSHRTPGVKARAEPLSTHLRQCQWRENSTGTVNRVGLWKCTELSNPYWGHRVWVFAVNLQTTPTRSTTPDRKHHRCFWTWGATLITTLNLAGELIVGDKKIAWKKRPFQITKLL